MMQSFDGATRRASRSRIRTPSTTLTAAAAQREVAQTAQPAVDPRGKRIRAEQRGDLGENIVQPVHQAGPLEGSDRRRDQGDQRRVGLRDQRIAAGNQQQQPSGARQVEGGVVERAPRQAVPAEAGRPDTMHRNSAHPLPRRQVRIRALVALARAHDVHRETPVGQPEGEIRQHLTGCRLIREEVAVHEDDLARSGGGHRAHAALSVERKDAPAARRRTAPGPAS